MAEPEQLVRIGAVVTAPEREALEELARRRERSMAAEIRLALRAWLEEQERAA